MPRAFNRSITVFYAMKQKRYTNKILLKDKQVLRYKNKLPNNAKDLRVKAKNNIFMQNKI